MSADIEILDDDKGQWLNLTIRAGGCIELDICVPQRWGPTREATVRFDLHKKDHTEAIKKLISHLQHQLEIATDLFPETVGAYKGLERMAEKVNHPSHYQSGEVEEDGTSKYEAIKVIEAWDLNFHLGNVIKYISRAGKKSENSIEDLKKAEWYLSRYVQFIQKTNN